MALEPALLLRSQCKISMAIISHKCMQLDPGTVEVRPNPGSGCSIGAQIKPSGCLIESGS